MDAGTNKTAESFIRYLGTGTEDERPFGMVCVDAGYNRVKSTDVYPPNINAHPASYRGVVDGRILPEFQIGYLSAGEGVFETENATYKTGPGSMTLVLPGMRHRSYLTSESGFQEYWVGFKGDFFSRLLDEGVFSKDFVCCEAGLSTRIISTYRRIFDEVRTRRPHYQIRIGSEILSLIATLLDHKQIQERPDPYQKIVEKAKGLMTLNLHDSLDMSAFSHELGVCASHFNKIFKTYTSMTPYQYYINIKIDEAKHLLERDGLTVTETAYRLGFEDPYYFSRLFKNKTGVTPKNWKKSVIPPDNMSILPNEQTD
ncbi:MAG: AraC family transcriptional regulator [Spirochaetaceae bacterium]|jgi:AraC-like DNA-binding protein|nr:AraC family transcriptional regulator [Spirochaetaceae bacterium]